VLAELLPRVLIDQAIGLQRIFLAFGIRKLFKVFPKNHLAIQTTGQYRSRSIKGGDEPAVPHDTKDHLKSSVFRLSVM
jgi:hypothetical protein